MLKQEPPAKSKCEDDPIDERVASCLVSRAQGWRFEDPMGRMVKTSYAIN